MTDEDLETTRRRASREEALWEVTADYLSSLPAAIEDAAYRAAVVHWFDADILEGISGGDTLRRERTLEDEPASALDVYAMIQDLPFVEVYVGRGHNVHSLTRRTVLDHLWHDDPDFYRNVSRLAAAHFGLGLESDEGTDWEEVVEHIYHLLVADEEQGLAMANEFAQVVSSMGEHNLFHALIQAGEEQWEGGRLSDRAGWEIRGWRAWQAFFSEDYQRAIALATEIAESKAPAPAQSVRDAARLIANCHLLLGRLDAAYGWYERALGHWVDESQRTLDEIVEDKVFTLLRLGDVCRVLGRYAEAEEHFSRALTEYVPRLLQPMTEDDEPGPDDGSGSAPPILPVWSTSPDAWIRQDETFYVTVRQPGGEVQGGDGGGEDADLVSWPVIVTQLLASAWMSLASLYEDMDSYALAAACANLAGQIALDADDEATASTASDLLYRVGSTAGDPEMARWMIEQQLSLLESAIDRTDRAGELAARVSLGNAYMNEGDYPSARDQFGPALALANELKDVRSQADVTESLAVLDWIAGEEQAARDKFEQELLLLAAAGYRQDQANALRRMGAFELSRHDPDSAKQRYEAARELFSELGIPTGSFRAHVGLADVERDRLRYDDALGHLMTAVGVARDIESPSLEAEGLSNVASVLVAQGEFKEAQDAFERALQLARGIGNPAQEAELLVGMGNLELAEGDIEDAQGLFEQGRKIYAGLKNVPGEIDALMGVADAEEKLDHKDQVVDAAETIISLAKQFGDRDTEVAALRRAALSFSWAGVHDRALGLVEDALQLDPADPSTLGTKSWVLNEAEDYEGALEASERGLARDSALTWVICNRALALLALSRSEEAIAAYQEAIEVRPAGEDFENDVDALKRLLDHRPDLDGGQEALSLLEKAQAEILRRSA